MVARKNSNFKRSQDSNEERRIKLVNDALVKLHAEKATYPDITSLAKRVAHMVALAEQISGKFNPLAYTTLLRNDRNGNPGPYRLQLEMYLSGRFDPLNLNRELTAKEIEVFIAKHPALQMYIARKDLEISNLRVQCEEQRRELRRVGNHLKSQGQDLQQMTQDAGQQQKDELEQARRDLAMTCAWINKFLRELGWVKIDEDNEVIFNMASIRKSQVADKCMFAPFFRALKIQRQGEGQNG